MVKSFFTLLGLLFALPTLAQQYPYFAPGGALSCSGACNTQSVNLNSGAFLLNTLPNSKLTNSAITINGTSAALGGTRTLNLASSDFANQGTGTTVLHGNASGNPVFGAVNLASDVTGTLPQANLLTCAANQIVFDNASAQLTCGAGLMWTDTTKTLTLGNTTLDPIITSAATTNGQLKLYTSGAVTNPPDLSAIAGAKSIVMSAWDGVTTTADVAFLSGNHDFDFWSPANDFIAFTARNTVAGAVAAGGVQGCNENFSCILWMTTSASYNGTNYGNYPAGETSLMDCALGCFLGGGGVAGLLVDTNQNVVTNLLGSNAVGDTNGFLYVPKVAGIPTGVPANLSGNYAQSSPLRFDSTDNRLYIYNGGWQNVAGSSGTSSTSKAKSGDTSRTSTTAVSDDPDLQFTSQVAGTYSVEWLLTVTGPTGVANFKTGINCTGTVTTSFWSALNRDQTGVIGGNAAQNDCNASTTTQTVTLSIAAGNYEVIQGYGFVVTSTTGTISLQWAQGTSNASAVTVKRGSWMRISKIL